MTDGDRRELDAFLWMQGRMVELLMRHDLVRFGKTFGEHVADSAEDQRLSRYRELAVVFYLRNELFDNILPRIKRRLSFAAPRELHVESLPPRGRIDWHRTMSASLRDRPGEPPLEVQTRQRRRHFVTPENILTVATILEYEQTVQHILDQEAVQDHRQALRHPLQAIVEACRRELVFPQFASLTREAQRLLEGREIHTIADLERLVANNLLPGHNSAYDDLLAWRGKLATLELLDSERGSNPHSMLGADPEQADYLYQCWLFYEIIDLLQQHDCLRDWNIATQTATFDWGPATQRRRYIIRHDRAIPHYWKNAPGVRPDFYMAHVDRTEIRTGAQMIWHEPGFVLDAKYYKPRDSSYAPGSTVKRMIADLQLTGEQHGALLFAFQRGESADRRTRTLLAPDEYEPDTSAQPTSLMPLYRVQPSGPAAQRGAPDQSVAIWRVAPQISGGVNTRAMLTKILDDAHAAICERRTPQCQGIFLDTLSAREQTIFHTRFGDAMSNDLNDLLLCPKPHVGPWRVDLVSRATHCCKDHALCHIAQIAGAQKPIRAPRTAEELLKELQNLFIDGGIDEANHAAVAEVAQRIEQVTRRFAEIAGAYRRLDIYYNRLRDLGLEQTLDLLGATERESLALTVFLVEQLDSIGASDYSAPAIHISSVMEIAIRQRVFSCPDLVGELANSKRQTLGVLPYLQRSDDLDGNWQRIQTYIAAHWNENLDPDDPQRVIRFHDLISKALNRISQLRNTAAHTNPLPRREYTELQNIIFQNGKLGYSALNALLLGWQNQPQLIPDQEQGQPAV
jgi:hypothetical protein